MCFTCMWSSIREKKQLQQTHMTFIRLCAVTKCSLPLCKKIQIQIPLDWRGFRRCLNESLILRHKFVRTSWSHFNILNFICIYFSICTTCILYTYEFLVTVTAEFQIDEGCEHGNYTPCKSTNYTRTQALL